MSIEKKSRNKRLYQAFLKGDSYRTIARRFRLDVKTIFVIIEREKGRIKK